MRHKLIIAGGTSFALGVGFASLVIYTNSSQVGIRCDVASTDMIVVIFIVSRHSLIVPTTDLQVQSHA